MDNDEEQPVTPVEGMIISIRTRQDVVVVDPQRFLAAARRAFRQLRPGSTEETAVLDVTDVYEAVHALLDVYGQLASDHPDVAGGSTPQTRVTGGVGLIPGERVRDRPDGLSPAGSISNIVLGERQPLQDYGCFLPDEEAADLR